MGDQMGFFKAMILIQIFYSLGMTGLIYAMPDDTLNYVDIFNKPAETLNVQNLSNKVQSSTNSIIKTPLIELGALVFYSGNIIVDLMLNFFFAVPEMVGLLFSGLGVLFHFDPYLLLLVEGFTGAIITIMYFLGILEMIMNIRSTSKVI
jgi:hypothetical protein